MYLAIKSYPKNDLMKLIQMEFIQMYFHMKSKVKVSKNCDRIHTGNISIYMLGYALKVQLFVKNTYFIEMKVNPSL